MDQPPRLVQAKVIAELFGVSIKTIHNWAHKGQLPSVRLICKVTQRETVRFDLDKIEALLKKEEVQK